MILEIVPNRRQLDEIAALLKGVGDGAKTALMRAVNKVAAKARTEIIRAVTAELNLKASDVQDKNVRLWYASRGHLEAVAKIRGRRIPLIAWGAHQIPMGVSYAIRRGARTRLRSAFVAAMPTSHTGVFIRSSPPQVGRRLRRRGPGRGTAGLVRPRLHITELRGPSVPEVVANFPEMAAGILEARIEADLVGEVDRQVGLLVDRRGGPAEVLGELAPSGAEGEAA